MNLSSVSISFFSIVLACCEILLPSLYLPLSAGCFCYLLIQKWSHWNCVLGFFRNNSSYCICASLANIKQTNKHYQEVLFCGSKTVSSFCNSLLSQKNFVCVFWFPFYSKIVSWGFPCKILIWSVLTKNIFFKRRNVSKSFPQVMRENFFPAVKSVYPK